MIVFWHLLLGHLLADFVLKRKALKTKNIGYFVWRAGLYFIALCLCCLNYITLPWFEIAGRQFNGFYAAFVAALAYFAVGFLGRGVKIRRSALFFFLARQFILVSILLIITPVLPFDGDFLHYIYGSDLLFIINSCIIVSYVLSAFLLRLSLALDDRINIKAFFDRRFLSMLLRVVLFLLILMPGWFGVLCAAVIFIYLLKTKLFEDGGFYFYIGCFITAAFAILCRGVFHGIC